MCRRKVARVSGNPGSTRELNFYAVNGAIEDQEFSITLVDMPGFGFAKLSKDEREEISRLAVSYLRGRKQLKAVILLNDCRRQPGEDERAIQGLCIEQGVRCIIVATKLDSIKRSQHQRALTAMAKGYHLERGDILATGEGIAPVDIWSRIVSLVS
jgi:GTP-binding protein